MQPETSPDFVNLELCARRTYRCKVCGARWVLNPPTTEQPGGSWNHVFGTPLGKCCDNVEMGDQIEAEAGEPAAPPVVDLVARRMTPYERLRCKIVRE